MESIRNFKYIWVLGLVVTLAIVAVPSFLVLRQGRAVEDDPWAHLPDPVSHTDHSDLLPGPYETGQEVTAACLSCHENAAHEVIGTTHWTWEAPPVEVPGRDEPIATGKRTVINNFCIGIQSNWEGCTSCHAGYGWDDADYDFTETANVDCLICHDQSGGYVKSTAGLPAEGVDLAAVAQSVASPTRDNCGSCHFNGGGGDAVKHGDLDTSLTFPTEDVDVHMGGLGFNCTDCHQTENHQIAGRSITVSVDDANQIYCTDCHAQTLHDDERLNAHTDSVACQTCHIPEIAVRQATKTHWDWSQAGQDIEAEPHDYLKIKGRFIYDDNLVPEYYWYSGTADRYLLGDVIDPTQVTDINRPHGDINDPGALLFPFKVHRAVQPYDLVHNYILQPKTVGEGGYWTDFDWDQAFRLGSEVVGLDYSGTFGWTDTEMWWPTTHMVAPADRALQCQACHGDEGRLDWEALGYPGDPLIWGSRGTSSASEVETP